MIHQLRSATQELHEGLEHKMYSQSIRNESLTKDEYVHMLLINYFFFREFEKTSAAVDGFDKYKITKASLAYSDLQQLDPNLLIPDLNTEKASFKTDSQWYLGALYVVLGSQLGSAMIHNKLSKQPMFKDALSFYAKSAAIIPLWKSFLGFLEEEATDEFLVTRGAIDAFNFFSILFDQTQ